MSAAVDHAEHVEHLRGEGAALARALQMVPPDASVPTCPGWTVADLAGHVGRTYRWATANVDGRPERHRLGSVEHAPEEASELVPWFRTGLDRLVRALDDAPADAPVWSWTGEGGTVAFWSRRMALETAVHRYDAQVAAGDGDPVDADLAVDGIDELLTVFPGRSAAGLPTGDGESLHLHVTDAAGEWLVRLAAAGPVVEHLHAKGDVAARGPASALFLHAWGRTGTDELEVFGDAALLERFLAAVRI